MVNAEICNHCMDCIPVCPTGSVDEWRLVQTPCSLDDQYGWEELPEQEDIAASDESVALEALDAAITALLVEARQGAGGRSIAPANIRV